MTSSWGVKMHPWWCHQMETFFALLAICAGNSPVTSEFPAQRPVMRSFDVFIDLRWINDWVNNREAGDLRCHLTHYDVTVMSKYKSIPDRIPKNQLFLRLRLFRLLQHQHGILQNLIRIEFHHPFSVLHLLIKLSLYKHISWIKDC